MATCNRNCWSYYNMYSALVRMVLEENTHSQEDCSVFASSAGDDGRDCLYLCMAWAENQYTTSQPAIHNITACNTQHTACNTQHTACYTQHYSLLFSSAWMLTGKVFQPSRLCDFPWMDYSFIISFLASQLQHSSLVKIIDNIYYVKIHCTTINYVCG